MYSEHHQILFLLSFERKVSPTFHISEDFNDKWNPVRKTKVNVMISDLVINIQAILW